MSYAAVGVNRAPYLYLEDARRDTRTRRTTDCSLRCGRNLGVRGSGSEGCRFCVFEAVRAGGGWRISPRFADFGGSTGYVCCALRVLWFSCGCYKQHQDDRNISWNRCPLLRRRQYTASRATVTSCSTNHPGTAAESQLPAGDSGRSGARLSAAAIAGDVGGVRRSP